MVRSPDEERASTMWDASSVSRKTRLM